MRALPELSVDARAIERLLEQVPMGETIPYALLSDAISRNVQTKARHLLVTARRRLHRKQRMVFAPVMNVGLKRLDDVGKVAAGGWHMKRSRRQATFALQKAAAVEDFASLPNDQKVAHNVICAQAGVLRHLTSRKETLQASDRISAGLKSTLSLKESLAAMKPAL